jgi:hypothetical protein
MPNILDVFNQDAFNVITLTESLMQMPYEETRLGQLGLFEDNLLDTRTVVIDEEEGQIQILNTKPLGGEKNQARKNPLSNSKSFVVPHIPFEDTIRADELAGKRKAGETDLMAAIRHVNDRLAWMRRQVELTKEIHMLGAIKGVVYDADASVILDMFSAFNVVQQTHNFDFGTASTDVRNQCVSVLRKIEAALGGIPYTRAHAFCGKNFFDQLVSHATVIDTYRYQQGQTNRDDLRSGFDFGGIRFEEYRGMTGLTGDIGIIGDDEAYCIPLGVSGLFRANYAPGTFMETVNQLAEPMYAKVAPDLDLNEFVKVHVQTNPLMMNTRPDTSINLTLT